MAMAAPTPMTTAPPPMPTDPRLLTLVQWLSPAYPLGAFAWSHGLETAVARGWVHDAATLHDWLTDILADGAGRADAVLIGLAYQVPDRAALRHLDATARALAPSAERLRETDRQGAAFARVTREVWQLDLPDCTLPVALGRAARLMDLPLGETAALYLHGFAGNLVSAAQRLMPLGQTRAQAVLAGLGPLCSDLSRQARTATRDDLWSHSFLPDIAAMQHETQQPRLFQS